MLALLLACVGADTGDATVYDDLDKWLCHPDLAQDACAIDLSTTVVTADGAVSVVTPEPAQEPAFDCFYVYPTTSLDDAGNADWSPGPEEAAIVAEQVAHFSTVCTVVAPLYRQVTVLGLLDPDLGSDPDLAYADVHAAWTAYRAARPDRPVLLMGHSQGARVIKQLLQDDPDATQDLIAVWAIGSGVDPAAYDKDLCQSASDTDCLVTYLTYPAGDPPDQDTRLAALDDTVACVSPAGLLGRSHLSGVFRSTTAEGLPIPVQPVWQDQGAEITTPWVRMPDLMVGGCETQGALSVLGVQVDVQPDDVRTDVVTGAVLPGWGLHLADLRVHLGDLLDLAVAQSES